MSTRWLLRQPVFFAFLMHFAALFSTLTHTATAQTGTTGDHIALLAIKLAITDDPNGIMTSWNHSNHNFCHWSGVTCNTRHQRVTRLDLPDGGLVGTLSPYIGNLCFLRGIQLSGNSFYGEIPPEIWRVFRLKELDLSNNSFTGNILATIASGTFPDVFQQLTNLTLLSLSGNKLTGTIPPSLFNSSSLDILDLSDNQLNGTLPENLGSTLPRLQMLLLNNNNIQGNFLNIPPLLFFLDLSFNKFEGKLPSLSNGSSLASLYLSNNFFVGSLRNLVCSNGVNMTESLYLDNNLLSGDIPNCWEKCSSLSRLSLGSNNLSGEFPKTLGSIPSLVVLDISRNKLKGDLTKSFRSLPPNLSVLDISENQFKGTIKWLGIPETVNVINLRNNEFAGSLHQFLCSNGKKGTQALLLGNNRFSGVIPNCWDKWPRLVLLSLHNNKLFGEIPTKLGFIPSLQVLNIGDNKISGRLPSSLMNCTYLKILQLSKNELVGSIPTWVGTKLTSLRVLNLRSNNFHESIPSQLCYLSHVQILDLAHNNLSGCIPRCFNNFSVLSNIRTNSDVQFVFNVDNGSFYVSDSLVMKGREYTYDTILGLVMLLDLSSNNFSGHIPIELTTLTKLQSLNLSRNQLIGKIPDKIGEIKSLESLDLSVNKLSGELPTSLSGLHALSNFNVSYNNLIGRVPTSTQIQSFSESSFFGNKLCGAPLANGCVSFEIPYITRDQKENVSHEIDWGIIISITLGSVCGFWIIVAPLIISTSWRITYFGLLGKLI